MISVTKITQLIEIIGVLSSRMNENAFTKPDIKGHGSKKVQIHTMLIKYCGSSGKMKMRRDKNDKKITN